MFGIFSQQVFAQTTGAALGDGASTVTDWQSGLINLIVIVGIILIPFVLSRMLAKSLRMPTHASAFFWILLATLSTSFLLVAAYTMEKAPKLKKGIDIVGGTLFIYEVDRSTTGTNNSGGKVVAKDFLVPLSNRLNPSGTKEYSIRPIGDDQIEITIPQADAAEIREIKRIITEAGILQFRIVANANDHRDIIDAATQQASSTDQSVRLRRDVKLVDKNTGEEHVAGIWRTLGRGVAKDGVRQVAGYQQGDLIRNSQTGQILNPPFFSKTNDFEKWMAAEGIADIDMLLALERRGEKYVEVNGSDLTRAQASNSRMGGYEVHFTMSLAGAEKLMNLTGRNLPDPTSDFKRRMAILLDGNVLSAPSLNSTIRAEGSIEGRFTKDDVDFLVSVLNSGALPGALRKEPISETTVGANMGRDAIQKGYYASMISLVVTILCVLLYYRFAGLIATIALLLNLGMILAVMILIKQPLTLSGIAGLVLSVGMSVDANVLVFERMREETERKASAKMAIRNGFDRAWTTIFDSNLTTLITAVVLYFIGTEQIKGFAITLIIGLMISLFTAVYVTHKLFEVAERWKFAWLGMSDYVNSGRRAIFGERDIDFLSVRKICYTVSAIIILIGLVATVARGRQLLDIDFNGGTSIVFTLNKGLPPDEARAIVNKIFEKDSAGLPIQTSLTSVDVQGYEKNSVYKIDVSLNDQAEVAKRLLEGFSDNQAASIVTFDALYKIKGDKSSGAWKPNSAARLVSFQEQPPKEPESGNAPESGSAEVQSDAEVNADPAKPQQNETVTTPVTPALDSGARSSVEVEFKPIKGEGTAKMNAAQVIDAVLKAAELIGKPLVRAQIELNPEGATAWTPESAAGYSKWNVTVPFDANTSNTLFEKMRDAVRTQPAWQSVSKIEGRVATEMQQRALGGLVLSLVFIMGYIWFRFQRLAYGIAAVVALIHDVLITLAFVSVSHWLFKPLGFLLIEDFKISLTMVAAFLTIIGYSLNDTIVVFDRIREVKGKSPNLTEQMINASVTQTLSRTLLTSSTTIVAILLMYIFGGEGIHGFAYCLFIGIVVGTYSSIFVAAPVLLWLARREQAARQLSKVKA